jgi:hypothetical protein
MEQHATTFEFVRFAFTLTGASVGLGVATGVLLVFLMAALQMVGAM